MYALIEDARDDPNGPIRLAGARAAALAAGRAEPLVIRVPLERGAATRCLSAVVDRAHGEPLGICCYNDDVAIALLAASRELGLLVPEELAIIGADATEIGQLVDPPLSTVAIDTPAILESLIGDLDAPPAARETSPPARFISFRRGATS